MTYTHKIDADKILTMGKGARKTWRLLGLPESLEAQRATVRGAMRKRSGSPRRQQRIVRDTMAHIPPGDPWAYPEPAPGSDDYLKD